MGSASLGILQQSCYDFSVLGINCRDLGSSIFLLKSSDVNWRRSCPEVSAAQVRSRKNVGLISSAQKRDELTDRTVDSTFDVLIFCCEFRTFKI